MDLRDPYKLLEPDDLASCAVFNSPHSGNAYPDALIARSRLTAHELRASEDALVDRLFGSAPTHGAPLLAAVLPRAWIDLNRSPAELDPALVEGVNPTGLNQRIAAGLGVVPRIVAEGTSIYDGKITLSDAQARIQMAHKPYHDKLEYLLKRASREFGCAVLFDCHSMPSDALRAAPKVRGMLPDIVLGDRFGASAGRDIAAEAQSAFQAAGFTVARNAPFAGGYITHRYGRPSRDVHAIQIEIDRGLYLDQDRIEPLPEFEEVLELVQSVVSRLARIVPGTLSVAAE
ncbi:MAG: N-formylglutamate amidohydrolase [Pseudomonadota bacterium]